MDNHWQEQVRQMAVSFKYPPTPDVATAVRQRLAKNKPARTYQLRPAWVLIGLLVLLLIGSLTVPQVRAAVLRIFRIGAIIIFEQDVVQEPTTSAPDRLPLAGETTLVAVQAQTQMPLFVPEGWRLPDRVFYQVYDWPSVVVFVWSEPSSAEAVQLSLYHIEASNFAYKQAESIQETTVQGQRAIWMEGGHWLQLQDSSVQSWHFVEGNVLIWWSEAGLTMRLETGLTLAETKAMAESLQVLPKE